MRKFCIYLLKLLIVIIACLYILDYSYSYVYKNRNPRTKISYLLSQKNKEIDYLFIGSSRVDNGIDPEIITSETGHSALNLGIQGGSVEDYLLMLKLVEFCKIKTKKIFVQIDFSYNSNNYSDIINSMLIPYIDDPFVYSELKRRQPNAWFLRYIPFYKYMVFDYKIGFREFFSTLINKKTRTSMESGYYPLYRNLKREGGLPKTIISKNVAFESIKGLVKKNKWNVVYYTAPICIEATNKNYLTKLEEKIPKLVNLASVFNNKPEYFHDCTHLVDAGAKAFTKIMVDKFIENTDK
ncbi:hypothetical protein [Pseudofulvibacter geojedonensis]|uniref:DUF1574 domain-containing protein n=1 Tax=Pseudofulvibacter geojedonensis TaxID=1123758 RepID=A0ABW3HYI2_9FLAO